VVVAKTERDLLLFDYYGELLNQRQQQFYRLYFHEDFSLAEIAGELQITRQAVHDLLRRTKKRLENYDVKLQLIDHDRRLRVAVERLDRELSGLVANRGVRRSLAKLVEII